jgi:hypothetical protein
MSALKLSIAPVRPPCNDDDASAAAPGGSDADPADRERGTLPATVAAEQLPPNRRPVTPRPGAVTPRRPLSALSSARRAACAPAAAVRHPDAAHHVEMQEPPGPHSHALSAVFRTNSTLDLDLTERPDTLVLAPLPRLAADPRKPDARARAETEAASRLRRKA